MIRLGTYDVDVPESAREAYAELLLKATRMKLADVQSAHDKLEFRPRAPADEQTMSVSEIQQALKDLGFFPGGAVDGICGYRTLSAIRLFQEYVRSVERPEVASGIPDGLFGKTTERHLRRWLDTGHTNEWASIMERWRAGDSSGTEYGRWLSLGEKAQAKYQAKPNRMLRLVREFGAPSDTHPVGEWDFSPGLIHMFGIRRDQFSGKFDDIFVFLIKGLVFKFQGSTEPGVSEHEDGRPFLVLGQHDYHFGWHQRRYLALKPQGRGGGVLVVRSKNDDRLDDADLDKGLSTNNTINVHWAGMGLQRAVGKWSAGCQVINGSLYMNHRGDIVDCRGFVAMNDGSLSNSKTRGAYNVLVDLATALSGDLEDTTVRYTLLTQQDLELDPVLNEGLERARDEVLALIP